MSTKNENAVNKAIATTKANELLFENMLSNFDKSLLKTSKGQSNDVYKKELYTDLTPTGIKTTRRKLRNEFLNICFSIKNAKTDEKLNSLIAYFIKFSKDTFVNFDFNNLQVSMFCSSNLSDMNKNSIKDAIDVINLQVEKLSKKY